MDILICNILVQSHISTARDVFMCFKALMLHRMVLDWTAAHFRCHVQVLLLPVTEVHVLLLQITGCRHSDYTPHGRHYFHYPCYIVQKRRDILALSAVIGYVYAQTRSYREPMYIKRETMFRKTVILHVTRSAFFNTSLAVDDFARCIFEINITLTLGVFSTIVVDLPIAAVVMASMPRS
jgi:hypothetical protein